MHAAHSTCTFTPRAAAPLTQPSCPCYFCAWLQRVLKPADLGPLKEMGIIASQASRALLVRPARLAKAMVSWGCPASMVRAVAQLQHCSQGLIAVPQLHSLPSSSSSQGEQDSSSSSSSQGEHPQAQAHAASPPPPPPPPPPPAVAPHQQHAEAPLALPAGIPPPDIWASCPYIISKKDYGLPEDKSPGAFNAQMQELEQMARDPNPNILRSGVFEGQLAAATFDRVHKDVRR